jgi:nucleotide-binding universal stress UspA family protein
MIPEYKKILYATDLSVNSAHAFKHAISLARRYNAKITLLHVLPEVDASTMNYVATVMGEDRLAGLELEHKAEIKDEIRRRLHKFAKEELIDHPEDAQRIAEIEVHYGSPVAHILQHADGLGVDMIVLGSHGKGALKYAFLGSVAEKVLRKSHRPMLVVPLDFEG